MDQLSVEVEEYDNARKVTVTFAPVVEVEEVVEVEAPRRPNY